VRSGELARLAGVSTDTLRHYERLGLLPKAQRTEGGYRQYTAQSLERVRLIRRALTIGFSLPELTVILKMRRSRRSAMLQSKKDSGVQTARGQGADHRFARYARPTCRHSKGLELTAGPHTKRPPSAAVRVHAKRIDKGALPVPVENET